MPQSAVKDKNYDLLNVVHASLQNVWMLEGYIADAEKEGDTQLADWLRKIQDNNAKGGQQGKQLLVERLSSDG